MSHAATGIPAPSAAMACSTAPLVRTYRCVQAGEPPSPVTGLPQVYVTILPAIHDVWENQRTQATLNFNRINHAGHLMEHFGGWLIVLLTLQIVAAWNHGVLANHAFRGGIALHSALFIAGAALLNLAAWHRYRGRPARDFRLPGLLLFALTILPGLTFRILNG